MVRWVPSSVQVQSPVVPDMVAADVDGAAKNRAAIIHIAKSSDTFLFDFTVNITNPLRKF